MKTILDVNWRATMHHVAALLKMNGNDLIKACADLSKEDKEILLLVLEITDALRASGGEEWKL